MSDKIWESGADGADGDDSVVFLDGMHKRNALGPNTVVRGGFYFVRSNLVECIVWTVAFLGMMLAAGCILSPLSFAGQMVGEMSGADPMLVELFSTLLSQVGSFFIQTPIMMYLMAGLIVFSAEFFRGEDPELGVMFSQFGPAWKGTLVTWVVTLISYAALGPVLVVGLVGFMMMDDPMLAGGLMVGVLLTLMPVFIYVALGWALATYSAVLNNLGPMSAIQYSWQAVSGARLSIIGTGLVLFAVSIVLLLACCVPVLLATPIQLAGFSLAWLLLTHPESETEQWEHVRAALD